MTTIRFKDLSLEDLGETCETSAENDSQKEAFGILKDEYGDGVFYKSKTDPSLIYCFWQDKGFTVLVSLYKIVGDY